MPSWLHSRAISGELPHLKVGRKIYFARNGLEAALVELASAQLREAPP